jgi:glycosyltransferase involved in cell wall biosynthesis
LVGTEFPLISSEHTSAAHFDEHPVQRVLTRYAQQVSFAKTVVSQQVFEEHPAMRRGNLHVLPNPVNLDAFESARGCWPTEKSILCVGGLRPEKDQQTLIAAFDRVAGEFPDWKLRIVGDGSERPAVERSIAQSAYASRIELPGVIRDVAAEYRNASFVAMPSRYESLGLVAIEAMASGRPVIGFSDCAGAVTLIKHSVNGLLADPGRDRAGSLAAALRLLMANEELCRDLGSSAPDTVKHYSAATVIDHWESLLKAAASTRSAAISDRRRRLRESNSSRSGQ